MTGQALERREPQRRYPILMTLLAQSATDVLDEVVQLFDQAVSARESKAAYRMRDGSYGYLRQFTPHVLEAVRFGGGTAAVELLEAVEILKELNATGARRVPEGAPTGFVPTRCRDPQRHPRQRLPALVSQLHPHPRSTAPGRVASHGFSHSPCCVPFPHGRHPPARPRRPYVRLADHLCSTRWQFARGRCCPPTA